MNAARLGSVYHQVVQVIVITVVFVCCGIDFFLKSKWVIGIGLNVAAVRFYVTALILRGDEPMRKLLLWSLSISFCFCFGLLLARQIDDEVERSLIVTYIGPESDVEFDIHHQRETMVGFPSIYCEGDFEFHELIKQDGSVESVCLYSGEPRKGHTH